jgi:hypothetical protein
MEVTITSFQIRGSERQEAEKYYLRTIINNKSPITEHPRYNELVEVYGAPQEEKKEAQTLSEEMISIFIHST